jgi:hypothetical protein
MLSLFHILIVQRGFPVIFPYMNTMYFDHIHPLILFYPPLPLKALQLVVGNEHLELRELQFKNRIGTQQDAILFAMSKACVGMVAILNHLVLLVNNSLTLKPCIAVAGEGLPKL